MNEYYCNEGLSEREATILKLMTKGYDNEEIAKEISVSLHTVKAQISIILRKLDAKNRTVAVYKALKDGTIE